jgi:hypothetical protein
MKWISNACTVLIKNDGFYFNTFAALFCCFHTHLDCVLQRYACFHTCLERTYTFLSSWEGQCCLHIHTPRLSPHPLLSPKVFHWWIHSLCQFSLCAQFVHSLIRRRILRNWRMGVEWPRLQCCSFTIKHKVLGRIERHVHNLLEEFLIACVLFSYLRGM